MAPSLPFFSRSSLFRKEGGVISAAHHSAMRKRGRVLPSDLVPVEYLQSSGTQYVNTGVLPSSGMEIGVKCQASSVSANGWDGVVGSWIADESDKCVSIRYNIMTKIAPTYAGAVRYAGVGEWITIQSGSILEIVLREGFASVNGTGYTWTTVPLTVPPYPFFCFVENLGGSPWGGRYLKGRIYYLWMMCDGKLVFDAIPVRNGSTGYLYDFVSKRALGNAGSGSFTYGSDIDFNG